MQEPEIDELWEHAEGGWYVVAELVTLMPGRRPAVKYIPADGPLDVYVRELDNFLERFTREEKTFT